MTLGVELDEFLVHASTLGPAEAAVLVKDGCETPLLQLAETPNKTAGTVLALVAVDQHRVVASIEDCGQRSSDLVLRY